MSLLKYLTTPSSPAAPSSTNSPKSGETLPCAPPSESATAPNFQKGSLEKVQNSTKYTLGKSIFFEPKNGGLRKMIFLCQTGDVSRFHGNVLGSIWANHYDSQT